MLSFSTSTQISEKDLSIPTPQSRSPPSLVCSMKLPSSIKAQFQRRCWKRRKRSQAGLNVSRPSKRNSTRSALVGSVYLNKNFWHCFFCFKRFKKARYIILKKKKVWGSFHQPRMAVRTGMKKIFLGLCKNLHLFFLFGQNVVFCFVFCFHHCWGFCL